MKRIVRMPLSVEACVALEIGLCASLNNDEELYARNILAGIPETDEELVFLLQSIGGQRVLLEVLRKAVGIDVLVPME